MKTILMAILLIFSFNLTGELKYQFSYLLKGGVKGKTFLIIPYRIFYESSATINLSARKCFKNCYEFVFNNIESVGYMMRTSGLKAENLIILTAYYDFKKNSKFSDTKIENFIEVSNNFSKYIKEKKKFFFKILHNHENSLRFVREISGIHDQFFFNLATRFKYYPEILNICFNIYKILQEMLKIYNHSFLPEENTDIFDLKFNQKWISQSLDLSRNFNSIAYLASKNLKKYVFIQQKRPFHLEYFLSKRNASGIEICGEAHPDIEIWKKFRLKDFSRRITFNPTGNLVISDNITINIKNKKGYGAEVKLNLEYIE